MNARPETITEEVMFLPREARALLADRLIESLDGEHEEIEHAWLAEAKRRQEEIQSGKVNPIPGDEVFAMVRKSLDS